tara:strand:+ start:1214 stop:1408 length:195 start_codon:yes stop_codon:yes gene_type:complete
MEDELPIIKIVKETEVTSYDWELEMDNDTHDMMVKWGKEVATDQDYVNIAIIAGLTEFLNKHET